MADDDSSATSYKARSSTTSAGSGKSAEFKVRRYNKDYDNHPVVFRSESEVLAKHYIKTNHPRGAEVYLEGTDGSKKHYSADLEHQGEEDSWPDFETED